MKKGASRIAVDAFSRGRSYPNTHPGGRGNPILARREVQVTLITQEAECAIFTRHECSVFVRR